ARPGSTPGWRIVRTSNLLDTHGLGAVRCLVGGGHCEWSVWVEPPLDHGHPLRVPMLNRHELRDRAAGDSTENGDDRDPRKPWDWLKQMHDVGHVRTPAEFGREKQVNTRRVRPACHEQVFSPPGRLLRVQSSC